jgi:hypothetical protein
VETSRGPCFRTIRLRRERTLAHQRKVMRAQSAIQMRFAEELHLRADLKREKTRRRAVAQHLLDIYRHQAEHRGTERRVWLPSPVSDAFVAASCCRTRSRNHQSPDWAAKALEQQLRDLDVAIASINRALTAKRSLAVAQEAELVALQHALP